MLSRDTVYAAELELVLPTSQWGHPVRVRACIMELGDVRMPTIL